MNKALYEALLESSAPLRQTFTLMELSGETLKNYSSRVKQLIKDTPEEKLDRPFHRVSIGTDGKPIVRQVTNKDGTPMTYRQRYEAKKGLAKAHKKAMRTGEVGPFSDGSRPSASRLETRPRNAERLGKELKDIKDPEARVAKVKDEAVFAPATKSDKKKGGLEGVKKLKGYGEKETLASRAKGWIGKKNMKHFDNMVSAYHEGDTGKALKSGWKLMKRGGGHIAIPVGVGYAAHRLTADAAKHQVHEDLWKYAPVAIGGSAAVGYLAGRDND